MACRAMHFNIAQAAEISAVEPEIQLLSFFTKESLPFQTFWNSKLHINVYTIVWYKKQKNSSWRVRELAA